MNNFSSPMVSPQNTPRQLAPFQQRLMAERVRLTGDVNKLEAYIFQPEFANLPMVEKLDLQAQLEHMAMYLRVLDRRVARFTGVKHYASVKEVLARPVSFGSFMAMLGQKTNSVEDNIEGYLVEELDGGIPNHPDFANPIKWMAKPNFERIFMESP
jgi:hypothetical protein